MREPQDHQGFELTQVGRLFAETVEQRLTELASGAFVYIASSALRALAQIDRYAVLRRVFQRVYDLTSKRGNHVFDDQAVVCLGLRQLRPS